jgi:hypothetical protein
MLALTGGTAIEIICTQTNIAIGQFRRKARLIT